MLPRLLLTGAALCSAVACTTGPVTPTLQTPLTGEWSGTFESSWGRLPVKATLANDPYSQSISGSYVLDGGRATGTIDGALQTGAKDAAGLFHGTITISYATLDGQTCRSSSGGQSGSATSTRFAIESAGFTTGDCPDPPTTIRITLAR